MPRMPQQQLQRPLQFHRHRLIAVVPSWVHPQLALIDDVLQALFTVLAAAVDNPELNAEYGKQNNHDKGEAEIDPWQERGSDDNGRKCRLIHG